jgi:hypothetical protein
MSRIRTVKPEFWASEQITNLNRDARLLFIGIWNFSDDSGIHSRKAGTLRAEIFPVDEDITSAKVEAMIAELIEQGLVDEYEVNGKGYIRATGWAKHQRIDRPTFKHPWPCGTIPSNKEDFNRLFDESSPNHR